MINQESETQWDEALDSISKAPYLLGPSQLLEGADDDTAFLVDKSIPDQAISFIVGPPGSSKSWLAYSLALSVARGAPWLGRPVMRQGRVLVLSYDNPRKETARRFKRLGLEATDDLIFHAPEGPHFLRLGGKTEGWTFTHDQLLVGMIRRVAPVLVVVDSFRQAHVKDENSSTEMAQVMGQVKSWVSMGVAVVVVHHSSLDADGNLKARGSTEITGSADAMIMVQGNHADWSKTRSWPIDSADARIDFAITDDGPRTTLTASGLDAERFEALQALCYENPDEPAGKLAKQFGGNRQVVMRAIKVIRAGSENA